jgi:hypothetical protein
MIPALIATFRPRSGDDGVAKASCSKVADGRRPALAHLRQRRRPARSCTKVVGGCFMAARSTSLGVLQREHWISSHGKPPLIAWSMVGDGSIGSPSDHIRSFQLSQSNRSACCIIDSALVLISADCAARMLVIARALPSSLFRALRSPPERGVGWFFGAIRTSWNQAMRERAGDYSNDGQHPSSSWRPVRCWQVSSNSRWPTSFQTAWGPASRTASAFWISTVRPQRRQPTRSKCR